MPPEKKRRTGRIAILGRPNVGKSTLLNAFLGEELSIVSRHPQTTRDRILGILSTPAAQFLFLDTPGLHRGRTKLDARMNQQARDASEMADVVLLVAEARAEGLNDEDMAILERIPRKRPIVLVLNKVDRVARKQDLLPMLEKTANLRDFVAIVPLTARSNDGIPRVLDAIESVLPIAANEFDADDLTDRPMRFIVAEYVREQVLGRTYREVPHGVAVVVEEFEESRKVPRIRVGIHVDRPGHKKIIVGKRGEGIKAIGEGARAKIERMMGRQIHLELWVQVTPEWYETEHGLEAMGYGRSDEGSSR